MTRVISGAVLIALAAAAVWFAPPLVFKAVAFLLLGAAATELVGLARASGLSIPMWPSVTGAVITLAVLAFPASANGRETTPLQVVLLAQFVALSGVILGGWNGGSDGLARVSASLFP